MAEILPEPRQQNRFQLAHFKSARRFDEEQPKTEDRFFGHFEVCRVRLGDGRSKKIRHNLPPKLMKADPELSWKKKLCE